MKALTGMSSSAKKRRARILTWAGSIDDLTPAQKRLALAYFAKDGHLDVSECDGVAIGCGVEMRKALYLEHRADLGLSARLAEESPVLFGELA